VERMRIDLEDDIINLFSRKKTISKEEGC